MTARVGVLRIGRRPRRGAGAARRAGRRRAPRSSTRTPGRPPTCSPSAPRWPTPRALREETRGSHWREDFPERDDAHWAGHVDSVLDRRRGSASSSRPPPPTDRRPREAPRDAVRDAARRARRRAAAARARPRRGLRPSSPRALEEDLPGGGVDVTSVATIPADARGDGRLRRPRARRRRRARRSPRWSSHACMGDDVDVTDRLARRHPRRGRRRGDARRRADPRPAHRRAHRPQLRLPPLRRRHRHRRAGSTRSTAPAPGCSTPARRCPGCRALQKYAVRCGGGVNHRFSLSDMAMVKDNHVIAAGGVRAGLEAVRGRVPRRCPVEVEVTDLDQLARAARRGLRPDPARQHGRADDGRGGRAITAGRAHARGLRRAHPRARPRGRRDRRRLHLGRRADPLGEVFDLGLDLADD